VKSTAEWFAHTHTTMLQPLIYYLLCIVAGHSFIGFHLNLVGSPV